MAENSSQTEAEYLALGFIRIEVRSISEYPPNKLYFWIKPTTKLKIIRRRYAKILSIPHKNIFMKHGDLIVEDWDTPQLLGIGNGMSLIAFFIATGPQGLFKKTIKFYH